MGISFQGSWSEVNALLGCCEMLPVSNFTHQVKDLALTREDRLSILRFFDGDVDTVEPLIVDRFGTTAHVFNRELVLTY